MTERRYSIGKEMLEAPALKPGLHIVATPIGNLGDISLRALATLAAADVIYCEDTRVTAKLCQRYALAPPLKPYHEHNAAEARPRILAALAGGAALALVSDAGTPLVSDPGYKLVAAVLAQGHRVETIPGASAVLTALTLSGLPTDRFLFGGFLPQKAGERRRVLEEFAALSATLIFFESPHRIVEALAAVIEVLGDREVAVGRELTKLYEETLRGPASAVLASLQARETVKGEITLAIAPAPEGRTWSATELDGLLTAVAARLPASQAAAETARLTGLPKKDLYIRLLTLK